MHLDIGILPFTKNEAKKQRYINRHKNNESIFLNDPGPVIAAYWAFEYLWSYPTKEEG